MRHVAINLLMRRADQIRSKSKEVVEDAKNHFVFAADIRAAVKAAPLLEPAVRAAAIRIARLIENNPTKLNVAAWTLLTTEQEAQRDPVAALPIAQRAVEKSGGKDPGILDTLALAYFLTGDAAKAIEIEEKALALLQPKSTAVTDGGSVAKDGDSITEGDDSEAEQDAASQLRTSLEKSLARFRRTTSQPTTEQAEPVDSNEK